MAAPARSRPNRRKSAPTPSQASQVSQVPQSNGGDPAPFTAAALTPGISSLGLGASAAWLQGLQAAQQMQMDATRQAFDAWKTASDEWFRLHAAAWNAAAEWVGAMEEGSGDPERVEAEVEHVVNPLAASPLVWPMQEASRQAMTFASSAWNDWLSWTQRVADTTLGPRA